MTRFIIDKELFFLPYFSGFSCFSEFFRLEGLSLDLIYYLFDAALDFHVQKSDTRSWLIHSLYTIPSPPTG